MKKKLFNYIIAVLVLTVIVEGVVICYQQTLIKDSRGLKEKLELERKGLRYDNRGGDYCPACESKNVGILRYGRGLWEMTENDNKKNIGRGCVVSQYSKRFCCIDCGYEWGSLFSKKK